MNKSTQGEQKHDPDGIKFTCKLDEHKKSAPCGEFLASKSMKPSQFKRCFETLKL